MEKNTYHDMQSVQSAYLVALRHSHHGLLTRHLGHLKPPRTFLTRHLFIDGHLLPSGLRRWNSFGINAGALSTLTRYYNVGNGTGFFSPQNGHHRSFWMSEKHFRSHFSPFHNQYTIFILLKLFFTKQATCGCLKITFDHISSPFRVVLFKNGRCMVAI